MAIIKFIFIALLILLALTLGVMFLPAIIGILVGIAKFQSGKILGGIIAIAIGIVCQIIFIKVMYGGPYIGYPEEDEECPYCGSGATDGNHCYDCDEDF